MARALTSLAYDASHALIGSATVIAAGRRRRQHLGHAAGQRPVVLLQVRESAAAASMTSTLAMCC